MFILHRECIRLRVCFEDLFCKCTVLYVVSDISSVVS